MYLECVQCVNIKYSQCSIKISYATFRSHESRQFVAVWLSQGVLHWTLSRSTNHRWNFSNVVAKRSLNNTIYQVHLLDLPSLVFVHMKKLLQSKCFTLQHVFEVFGKNLPTIINRWSSLSSELPKSSVAQWILQWLGWVGERKPVLRVGAPPSLCCS